MTEALHTHPDGPEYDPEAPLTIAAEAICWERFTGQKVAISVLMRDRRGEITQYHRREWAAFALGISEDNEFVFDDAKRPPRGLSLDGPLRAIEDAGGKEPVIVEPAHLVWKGMNDLPPYVAFVVFTENDRGEIEVASLVKWASGLTPEQQRSLNLYQINEVKE